MGILSVPLPQRSGDRVDVVPDHADVRALWSSVSAHRVGKELAADGNLMSPGFHG